MLRLVYLASASVIALTAAANAADMYVRTPAGPGGYKDEYIPFSWTGCYIGGDAGGAWGGRESASANPSPAENQGVVSGHLGNSSSAIGGGYAGCNYQFAQKWVIGFEGDFSWTKLNGAVGLPNLLGNGAPAGAGGISISRSTDWLASLRGRLGYSVVPNMLVYGTGGVAWAHSSYAALDAFNNGTSFSASASDERSGWVAGGGIDWAPWSNNWVFRVEYLHYQFGGSSFTGFDPTTVNGSVKFGFGNLEIDTVRTGVSYKFGSLYEPLK
jgi:outer membrane immunogenic protein